MSNRLTLSFGESFARRFLAIWKPCAHDSVSQCLASLDRRPWEKAAYHLAQADEGIVIQPPMRRREATPLKPSVLPCRRKEPHHVRVSVEMGTLVTCLNTGAKYFRGAVLEPTFPRSPRRGGVARKAAHCRAMPGPSWRNLACGVDQPGHATQEINCPLPSDPPCLAQNTPPYLLSPE